MTYLILLSCFAIALIFGLGRSYFLASRLSRMSWEELVKRLEPTETAGITAVAREHLNPIGCQLGAEPNELWDLIGRAEGLARMRSNAEVLIALAAHASSWNFDESVIVAERMRRDGLALKRAARGITLSLTFGYGRSRGAFYVHEAASAYHLMRNRLLALYETSHAGRYPRLLEAL